MTIKTLREAVAEQISTLSPAVSDKVVTHFVEVETRKRTDAIVKGMDELSSLNRERMKIAKPDNVTYNADRSIAGESYSKERLDILEKHDKKLDKLTKAIDKAIGGDMSDLYNIGKSE